MGRLADESWPNDSGATLPRVTLAEFLVEQATVLNALFIELGLDGFNHRRHSGSGAGATNWEYGQQRLDRKRCEGVRQEVTADRPASEQTHFAVPKFDALQPFAPLAARAASEVLAPERQHRVNPNREFAYK